MKKLSRLFIPCAIIVVSVLGYSLYTTQRPDMASSTKDTVEKTYSIDDARLNEDIQGIIDTNARLDLSVSVVDLQTGKHYHYGESASYDSASIGKLVSATAFLRKVEMGDISLADQVNALSARSQLTKMIVESDNNAWHDINQVVTTEGLSAFAASIGLTSYKPDNNILSSNDVALLLSKLASQKLLDSANTNFLLSLMKEASMRSYIVAAIPDSTEVYHKVGYLADRLHDAAIIKKDDRAYVLVIFSKSMGKYDFMYGASLYKSITEITLNAFFAKT